MQFSDPIAAVCVFELHFPQSESLKDKRQPLRSIKDIIRDRFHVSICEFGNTDLWQRSSLACAMVAEHEERLRKTFNDIRHLIESRGVLVVDMETRFL